MKRKLIWKMLLLGSSLLTIHAWGNKTISFTADLTGNLDIYIMDINRKNPVNLTNHPAEDSSPTWSPDGSAFAYVSHRDGNPEIYVMEMKNKESRRLTRQSARLTSIPLGRPMDAGLHLHLTITGNMQQILTST